MRLLVHLSREHPTLPEAELRTVLESDGYVWEVVDREGRLLVGDLHGDTGADPAPSDLVQSLSRLAMTHEVAQHRATIERSVDGLAIAAHVLPPQVLADGETFAVRAERADPEEGRSARPGRREVEKTLGGILARSAPVDLLRPDRVVRVWLARDEAHLGDILWTNDRGSFDARATRFRPFFSPISGHPRWMRALVNLAAGPPPDVVYDPLCGTGGILLEAALAGHRVVGSDLDPRMAEGAAANLSHAEIEGATTFAGDVREAPRLFPDVTGLPAPGCIVTDLPYGQSASTGKEGVVQVARWTLETIRALLPAGHRAVVGVADPGWLEPLPSGLHREASYAHRVHKSLTRTYVVLRALQ